MQFSRNKVKGQIISLHTYLVYVLALRYYHTIISIHYFFHLNFHPSNYFIIILKDRSSSFFFAGIVA